jgi:predicted NUDIX family phosphoesterase
LINDDANPVGAVHLGLVQIVRVPGRVEIREKHVLEGHLVSPAELRDRLAQGANFETWSARLVEALSDLLPHRRPSSDREPAAASAVAPEGASA